MASSTFFHKPELALRRALELEAIHQPEASLELLHEVLSSRRHRTWSTTYEQIMLTYLNLCLTMHKSREAKDGLHQYRNLSQSQAPGSLEKVIRYLMEKAELKCSEAKASVDKAAAASATTTTATVSDHHHHDDVVSTQADAEDEDAFGASPQAILLSTMSTDPAKTQRDSTLLLPSLKFLWETYRAVLDILKSNSKLEHVYHAAAMGALRFCRTYKRRTEFRRLCDLLRMHLGNLQKYGNQMVPDNDASKPGNSKVRGWEGWTTEAIELHLQTRFMQLETSSVLHLHTEGFRTVEDIYNILQISHARTKLNPEIPPPKAKLMAAYYEKLTTLFWVSENYLFHAFAWYKYYTLCKEYNRGMSEDMKRMQVSAVLLAALCIPSLPMGGASSPKSSSNANNNLASSASSQPGSNMTASVEDDIVKEKMARMATLLGFHTRNPTREALLTEIRSKNILELAPPYLRELYMVLEENSDPLIMVERAQPLLEQLKQEIGATNANISTTTTTGSNVELEDASSTDQGVTEDNTLGRYVKPLTSVLLLQLVMNLSAAYHTVSMDHLKKLTNGLDVTFEQVEKAIVIFTQTKTLTVRIDHRAGCLRFGDAQLESDAMRSQLTVLSKQLEAVCRVLEPPDLSKQLQQRQQLFLDISARLRAEHTAALERKNVIEKRKEEAERLAQEKVREELRIKAEEEAARKVEEEQRIAREQKMREQEKQLKIQRELESMEKKKYLEAMGHKTDAMTEAEMAQIDTAALQKEHQEKVNKEREAIERKKRESAKQLDYLVRAVRIEELPLIKQRYEEKIKKDRERYEAEVIEKVSKARIQWQSDVEAKEKLQVHAVFDSMAEFESLVFKGRRALHQEACREADRLAELEAEKGKLKRARRRKEDEKQKIAEEEARRKAEEEKSKEEEETRRREEARREKEAREEERRQAELARMQEERDRKERERQQTARPPPPSRDLDNVAAATTTNSSTAAASSSSFSAAAATAASGGNKKYVPPSIRNRSTASATSSGGGGGGGDGGGDNRNRFDRGGYPGGGRYEGRSGGDRRDDRRGGFDDRRGGGGSGMDDRRSGGGGSGTDDRRSGGSGMDDRRSGGGGFGGGDRRYGDRDGGPRRDDRDRPRDDNRTRDDRPRDDNRTRDDRPRDDNRTRDDRPRDDRPPPTGNSRWRN